MARAQTVFSELYVGKAIGAIQDIKNIENVDENNKIIYEVELEKRKKSTKNNLNSLEKSGLLIREYLLKNGVIPQKVVWTGAENVGAMVAVAKDLEVSNFRISVKENADVFINGSPITIFEDIPCGIFGQRRKGDDWYILTAKSELNEYYKVCKNLIDNKLPVSIEDYYESNRDRKEFSKEVAKLHKNKTIIVLSTYKKMCQKVRENSAEIFNQNIKNYQKKNKSKNALSAAFHYFFKVNGVKYILAGTEKNKAFAVILKSSSEWLKEYELLSILATPNDAGQPEVNLNCKFKNKITKEEYCFVLRIEIRWSHGKFCGNPEAKVYKTWSYTELPWIENLNLF
ncbi:MAG: hypothetical protein NTX05_07555 [Fusobacteria bacterium]|nr:hypothetical protein [Fusobacteriota bacterium]